MGGGHTERVGCSRMIETQMAESQQYCTQQCKSRLLSLQQFTSWTDQPMPFASRKVQYMTNPMECLYGGRLQGEIRVVYVMSLKGNCFAFLL